jgi:hypothetical protein
LSLKLKTIDFFRRVIFVLAGDEPDSFLEIRVDYENLLLGHACVASGKPGNSRVSCEIGENSRKFDHAAV